MKRRHLLAAGIGALAAPAVVPAIVHADARYPDRTIRLVVPFPAGGATDVVGRMFADKLTHQLGQTVIVDNKSGAAGAIGAVEVKNARPDGYTLLVATSSTHAINPTAFVNPPYDPVKDFTPLSYVCETGLVVLVHPSVPAKNIAELVGLLKASPDKYNYASSGVGSVHHLAGELFKSKAGVKATHVPYKGAGPALSDLVAGQLPIMFATIGPALPMIASGKARALGVTSARRSSALPDVPTLAEQGLAGYDASLKFSLVAPAGLPAPIAARLQSDLKKIVSDPELAKALQKLGNDDVGPRTPDEVTQITGNDLKKWGSVIREAGITLDS